MPRKVSFDFDSTLDRPIVQLYAQKLIALGIDVWICTSRATNETMKNPVWNADLFSVANRLGIPKSNIQFCEHKDKYHFFQLDKFVWHLDDDTYELKLINKHTKTRGISVFGNSTWINKCNKLLQI
jgi:hypothetical protein